MENIKFKALEVREVDGEFKREIIKKKSMIYLKES